MWVVRNVVVVVLCGFWVEVVVGWRMTVLWHKNSWSDWKRSKLHSYAERSVEEDKLRRVCGAA